MKKWLTEIIANDAKTGVQKKWAGPVVNAINLQDAEYYCQNNGLGYCRIIGELIVEIPCKKGTYEPDFESTVDYEQPMMN